MQSETALEELMVRYQAGDGAAVSELVRRLSPPLHRFFQVGFVSRRHADDLLQETWLRIHEVRHTYRPGQPVLPWLYAIARHVRVDQFRKARRTEDRERQVEQFPDVAAPSSPPPSGPDLRTMLSSLPESQREVLTMLKVADMSLEEVARATSSTVGSVKQKVHRAYEKLRQVLQETRQGTA